jgi:hypothetical protein
MKTLMMISFKKIPNKMIDSRFGRKNRHSKERLPKKKGCPPPTIGRAVLSGSHQIVNWFEKLELVTSKNNNLVLPVYFILEKMKKIMTFFHGVVEVI